MLAMLGLSALFLLLCNCYEEISEVNLKKLQLLGLGRRLSLDPVDRNNHLAHLNRTRVPGSEGSLYTREYIRSHFNRLNSLGGDWDLQEDNFQERGFNFSNIVVRSKDSYSNMNLVLAAHYDTLIEPKGFIGAIDSAVSCGIILDISESINLLMDQELEMGLTLIFFDGEEALEHWSATDSIYGARHLHTQWLKSGELNRIDHFILLDLLGADINYIPSYFPQTHDNYNDLSLVERRLHRVFPKITGENRYFAEPSDYFIAEYQGYIEDDHIPFLRSGVPILHLIPARFPSKWHTKEDDFHHVDIEAVHKWAHILAVYVMESLEISL
jgi:glutaminyl-peptide cyclotransferase